MLIKKVSNYKFTQNNVKYSKYNIDYFMNYYLYGGIIMNENNISLMITTLIETVLINYEVLKRRFQETITKSRLVDNIINIYAQKGLCLTNSQIETYRDFARVRQDTNERFEKLIKNQDCAIVSYMLKDNSDLDIMFDKVNTVKKNQDEMMNLCDELIEKSNLILEAL